MINAIGHLTEKDIARLTDAVFNAVERHGRLMSSVKFRDEVSHAIRTEMEIETDKRIARQLARPVFLTDHERPRRMWVNQPSTLQTYHQWHGTHVLAIPENDPGYSRAYLLGGDTQDFRIQTIALSEGWPR